MAKKTKDLSFEDAIKELESIVKNLEEGNLDLEKSLSVFQRGIELYQHLNTILDDAKGKVSIIIGEEKDSLIEKDFDIKL